jgi:hypothetical protein
MPNAHASPCHDDVRRTNKAAAATVRLALAIPTNLNPSAPKKTLLFAFSAINHRVTAHTVLVLHELYVHVTMFHVRSRQFSLKNVGVARAILSHKQGSSGGA